MTPDKMFLLSDNENCAKYKSIKRVTSVYIILARFVLRTNVVYKDRIGTVSVLFSTYERSLFEMNNSKSQPIDGLIIFNVV